MGLDDDKYYSNNNNFRIHPVGRNKANELGIYDMSGNVDEWCNDLHGEYPSGVLTDPTGASTGSFRVIRSGEPDFFAELCRSATRNYSIDPSSGGSNTGFRLAITIPSNENKSAKDQE